MLLVTKFGGTSVGNLDRIQSTAEIIKKHIENGDQIVVVISAMSGITDEIYQKCSSIHPQYHPEYDQALIVGEQISASLLSMALENLGFQAKSYNCWNLPIYGDGEYGDGFITEINTRQIQEDLNNQIIPIITGFQAIKKNGNRALTLGRGGSDYTAVMVAAAIHADICYIYTDVSGVYDSDPRILPGAKKIKELSYDEIIEMADGGAKVLQLKSVIAAKKYKIYMKVVSSFDSNEDGTVIANSILLKRDDKIITLNYKNFEENLCKITIFSLNKDEILDLEEIKNSLEILKIEIFEIEKIQNSKIELLISNEKKENCLKTLFSLFSQKHS
jgi:aspartate kinase